MYHVSQSRTATRGKRSSLSPPGELYAAHFAKFPFIVPLELPLWLILFLVDHRVWCHIRQPSREPCVRRASHSSTLS